MYILFSGFRGTYRPPALPSDGRTVSGKAYAWRLLGMMPAISNPATVAQTTEWLTGVCRLGSASTNILFNYNVYFVYILFIYTLYTFYIQSKIF